MQEVSFDFLSESIVGIPPSDSERTIGENGKLTCMFTSKYKFNAIHWDYSNTSDTSQGYTPVYFYNIDGLVQSSRHLLNRSTHSDTNNSFSLIIHNLEKSDDGIYLCRRVSATVMSANVTLKTICKLP